MSVISIEASDFRAENLAMLQPNVMVTMLWPDDEVQRRSVLMSLLQDSLEEQAISSDLSLTFSADFFLSRGKRIDPKRAIDDATVNVVEGGMKAEGALSMTGGTLAGEVLLQGFAMQDRGDLNIGLGACLELVSGALQGKNRSKRARTDDLRKVWHRYKNVAHLWAAYLVLDYSLGVTIAEFGRFLLLSELNRNRGMSIRHRNAKTSLLEPETTWRLPASLGAAIIANDPELNSSQFFCG